MENEHLIHLAQLTERLAELGRMLVTETDARQIFRIPPGVIFLSRDRAQWRRTGAGTWSRTRAGVVVHLGRRDLVESVDYGDI